MTVLLLVGCAKEPALTLSVAPRDFEELIEVDGHVDALRYRDILAPPTRYERRLIFLVDEGTEVKTGDMIAQFDPAPIQLAIDELEDWVHAFDQKTADIKFQGNAESYEQQVRADTAKQQVLLGGIRREKMQFESIIVKTTTEVEYNTQVQGANSAADQRRRFELRDSSRARERKIQFEYIQQKIKDLKTDTNQLILYAEQDGVVLRPLIPLQGEMRKVQLGDYLDRGQTFLRMPDPSELVVRFHLEEAQINRLREKMEMNFRTAGHPGHLFRGTVLSISRFPDPSLGQPTRRLFEVLVKVTPSPDDPPLRIGMVAHSRFFIGRYKNVYALPREWVTYDGEKVGIIVDEGKTQRTVHVDNPDETADYLLVSQIPGVQGAAQLLMPGKGKKTF